MLRFNLLPPELREHFSYVQKLKKVSSYIRVLLGLSIILSLFLIFILAYLQKQYEFFLDDLRQIQKDPQNIAYEKTQKEVTQFNTQLARMFNAKPSLDWPSLLIEIASLTPDRVKLHTLAVNHEKQGERIALEGEALTRESLIQFYKSIRQSKYFTNVSPPSNYEKTGRIPFQISFFIK